MIDDSSSEKSKKSKLDSIPSPWIIVILSAMLLMCSGIYSYTFGVFFKPIAGEFEWSRAVMSGAYAIRSLVVAAFVVPVGYLADRYGPRKVLLPCFLLLGISMIASVSVSTIWQLFLVQGLGIGIGCSGPFVCVTSTVVKWHEKRRGLALGIATAGTGLSSIIFPLVAANLIEVQGWRFAISVIGAIILAIGIPASLFMKDPPDLLKQKSTSGITTRRGLFEGWRLLPQFLKNPVFLALMLMFLLFNAVGNMLFNHLVNYATDIGIATLAAAAMMSAMGVASTTGRLGMGAISDRIGTKADASICCILLAISYVLLISKVPVLMWVAVVLFGIGYGGSVPLIAAIMGERVGIEKLAMATGVSTMGAFIGAALGPWLGGLIFDISGNYLWALILSVVFSIVALIIILRLPPPRTKTKYL